MASSSGFGHAASPILNPRLVNSPSHRQASISSEDEYPRLPCRNPVKIHIHVVNILRHAICLFAFVDLFLFGFTRHLSTTAPMIVSLIITFLINLHILARHIKTRVLGSKMPILSFQILCFSVNCGDYDDNDESRSLLMGYDILDGSDSKVRHVNMTWLFELVMAVIIIIVLSIHMVNRGYFGPHNWYGKNEYATCVASYVFGWLVVAFELLVVLLEKLRFCRGATVLICADEDVEAHVQRQIQLPVSPPVMSDRGGEHISIVA